MTSFWDRHAAYMKSPEWAQTRANALAHWGERCAACGETNGLQVDHLTYSRLGREELTDLLVLCAPCHRAVTEARRQAGAIPGRQYVIVTEKLFGIDLADRKAPKRRYPCESCGKPSRPHREGIYCVPCLRIVRNRPEGVSP
jgi:hypothetical protein